MDVELKLTQVEVNFIYLLLKREPLVQTTTEEGLSTGDAYRHRVLVALLEKLPYRETTEEERGASYKEVGVTPIDAYLRPIMGGNGHQW